MTPASSPAKKSPAQTLFLARPRYAELLATELREAWQLPGEVVSAAGVALPATAKVPALAQLVFARQVLPQAIRLSTAPPTGSVPAAAAPASILAMAALVMQRLTVIAQRANRQNGPWSLHVFSLNDDQATPFAEKLEKALLGLIKLTLPAWHRRYETPEALSKLPPGTSGQLLQIYMPEADTAWMSLGSLASGVSPWIGGNLRQRERQGLPSRSARKLEEAFLALGHYPQPGDTAVDLGAAPGGWSFTLARYGATVTAVDHGALAAPPSPQIGKLVQHVEANGLKYVSPVAVDWLCCDMLVAPRETLAMLERWLKQEAMQHFVVNLKLAQAQPWPVIAEAQLLLRESGWPQAQIKHLYHDRREVTLIGSRDSRTKAKLATLTAQVAKKGSLA